MKSALDECRMEVASRGLHPVTNDGSILALVDAAIAEMEAENKRLQVGWDCAELAVFLKDGLKQQAEAERDAYKRLYGMERNEAGAYMAMWGDEGRARQRAEATIERLRDELGKVDVQLGDARLTIERLKCCGNCGEWRPEGSRCYMGDDGTVFTKRMDPCHLNPSRWVTA